MTRPLIIGEAPSRTGDDYWDRPLSGNLCARLLLWAGISLDDESAEDAEYQTFCRKFEPMNLIQRWPGSTGNGGAAFPVQEAREAWEALLPKLSSRVVVLLGGRLASVAGLDTPHKWVTVGQVTMVYVPHPSGLNRVYNDPQERRRTGATLRVALRLAGSN